MHPQPNTPRRSDRTFPATVRLRARAAGLKSDLQGLAHHLSRRLNVFLRKSCRFAGRQQPVRSRTVVGPAAASTGFATPRCRSTRKTKKNKTKNTKTNEQRLGWQLGAFPTGSQMRHRAAVPHLAPGLCPPPASSRWATGLDEAISYAVRMAPVKSHAAGPALRCNARPTPSPGRPTVANHPTPLPSQGGSRTKYVADGFFVCLTCSRASTGISSFTVIVFIIFIVIRLRIVFVVFIASIVSIVSIYP